MKQHMLLYSIGVVVFSTGIRNGFTETVTYKQRSGRLRHADMWGEVIPGKDTQSTDVLRYVCLVCSGE